MTAWHTSPAGLLLPAKSSTWPRPVGWEQLPAAIRAEWDRRWRQANARQVGAR